MFLFRVRENKIGILILLGIIFACTSHLPAAAAPAVALGYTPKLKPGFLHFNYVNPDAPKGGAIVLSGFGTFDSLNPFVLKGVPASGLGNLVFEPLMVQSADEPYTLYGHIAEDIRLASDRLSVTFRLNANARFSDGSPVTAHDVKKSFDLQKGKEGHPRFRFYWADIKRAVVLSRRKIRFDFVRVNPELHLIAAQILVFSRKWVEGKQFSKLSQELPIGSGPYIVEGFNLGKSITYKRNPDYWARNHNTRRGMYNFDKVTFKYYRDSTVRLEALKAGEFDLALVNHSKQWARDYHGPQFDSGMIIREMFKHSNNAGMQGFVFNIRRPLFKDRRVRRALSLAFDFAWSNRNLFYDQYVRCDSYFSNSPLAARGLPAGLELSLLNKHRLDIPKQIFTEEWRPPVSDTPAQLRNNLREATELLKQAGWHVKDGVLQNDKGEPFEFYFLLAQKGFERILAPWAHNLKKLGITIHYRTVDLSLYEQRMRTFDFDMMVASFAQSQSPGNELFNLWHSKAAKQQGSNNIIGISDPVVDTLIKTVVYSKNRNELVAATRALDRVMLYQEYLVPNWYINVHRVAYWDKFAFPNTLPLFYQAESWALSTWWKSTAASEKNNEVSQ